MVLQYKISTYTLISQYSVIYYTVTNFKCKFKVYHIIRSMIKFYYFIRNYIEKAYNVVVKLRPQHCLRHQATTDCTDHLS